MPSVVSSDDGQPADLEETLDRLITASKLPAKSRAYAVGPLTTEVSTYAYEHGLNPTQLATVVDIVRKASHLDQASITNLTKGLYPANKVSSAVVFDVVCSIGQGATKPSPVTQDLLLRWLILIRETLEDKSALTRCYMVLFNQLGALGTRPSLCHLLALITKRKHVKPWRIQMLLEYLRNAVTEPCLLGLLQVYKEFYPDIIVDQPINGRPAVFKHPDLEWRDRLRVIQENNLQPNENLQTDGGAFRVVRRGTRSSRVTAVPEVHTFRIEDTNVSLEEIDGLRDFVEKFERIELPSQMVAALNDPLLQKYTVLRDQKGHQRRIDDWLSLFFDAQLQAMADGEHHLKDLQEVLSGVLSYTRYTKVLPGPILVFLSNLFNDNIWNGRENLELIIELLSFVPIQSFEELHASLLQPFEDCILDNTQDSVISLLCLYASIFRTWSFRLLSEPSPTLHALDALSAHTSLLTLKILSTSPPIASQLSVLSHFSSLAHIISHAPHHPHIRILTPHPLTVYLLTFLSPTPCTLSPLTSLLATYKLTFEATMTTPLPSQENPSHPTPTTPPVPYPRALVNEFNGFLMDICNLLWRSRAFNTADTNALGCLLPAPVVRSLTTHLETLPVPQSLHSLFSLSFNPGLIALSITVFREIEDHAIEAANSMDEESTGVAVSVRHAGPVTQRSLGLLGGNGGVRISWAEYRLEVLKWLGDRGVGGVGELMFCTMKHLMNGKVGASAQGTQGTQGTPTWSRSQLGRRTRPG